MKRKIRKKRQVRLQQLREKKEPDQYGIEWYTKSMIKLFDSHPYWTTASLSYYAFIYVDYHFGWEIGRPIKLLFLYDRMCNYIKYGLFMVKHPETEDNTFKSCFKELGARQIHDNVFIDDMILFEPKSIAHYYDTGYYEIIIRSGLQERFLFIQHPEKKKYEPYVWLFSLFDEIAKSVTEDVYDEDGWIMTGENSVLFDFPD